MWALSFSDGFLLGTCRFGQALKPGRPEISGESGVAMAEMDGIAVGGGSWGGGGRKNRAVCAGGGGAGGQKEKTRSAPPPRPARNQFGRQRRLPARWVTELYG